MKKEDIVGPTRKPCLSDEERKRVAYYLAGQVVVGKSNSVLQERFSLNYVTMVPQRGGYTRFLLDDGSRRPRTKEEWLAAIEVRLAGRITEKVIFGDLSAAGSIALSQVVEIIRQWGVDRPVTNGTKSVGEAERNSMANIIKECEIRVEKIVKKEMKKIEKLAQVILEKEELSLKEIDALGIF